MSKIDPNLMNMIHWFPLKHTVLMQMTLFAQKWHHLTLAGTGGGGGGGVPV